jgi:hypothetical protein
MKSASTLVTLALLASTGFAQYPADPASNLAVADAGYDQVQPKLAPVPSGGTFVSWFDSDPAGSPAFGYDVRLQMLDAGGREVWPHGGVLVADRGFSSTQDYGLDVDASGNALLVFRDDRFGGIQITANKVDATGALLWGTNGVQLTNTTAFLASPAIAGATDGAVFVAWSQDSSVGLQRLDAAGAKTWGANVLLTPPGGSYALSDMHAADAGAAIFSFIESSGSFGSPRHLYAQKVSAAGAPQWGMGHVKVYEAGSLQFGAFPDFVGDGAGGAVFSWYSSSPSLEAFAQHVSSAGVELFPHNGVSASTNASQVRVSPAVAFDAAEQETFLLYEELDAGQSQSGLSAQKFDATGNRMWGATGLNLIALGVTLTGDTAVTALDDGAVLVWSENAGFGQDTLHTQVLADDASVLASPSALSSTAASKFRVRAVESTLGHTLVVWEDDRLGSEGIYAQDILPDGSLGGTASTSSRNGSGLNPVVLTGTSEPVLGGLWQTSVDKSALPANVGSILFVYTGASSGLVLTEGEVLVDVFSQELLAQPAFSGPLTDTHTVPIPAAIGLVGLTLSSQALILDVSGSQLTNAIDLVLGL